MKAAFVANKYYTDSGMDYVYDALKRAFFDVELFRLSPVLAYEREVLQPRLSADFAIFWDKDYYLAAGLEKTGIRVFNNSHALMLCDDKQKTYSALDGIRIPKTFSAPLMYDSRDCVDMEFVELVADSLKFPIVVKHNTGSQGRQVFLANDLKQLKELYVKHRHIPHHYQEYLGEYGSDLRIYMAGHKPIAACTRKSKDFRSNLFYGGVAQLVEPDASYVSIAENISKRLGLDFGAIDFLICDEPVFLEVNTNAYFRGIEGLGANVADKICSYIKSEMGK